MNFCGGRAEFLLGQNQERESKKDNYKWIWTRTVNRRNMSVRPCPVNGQWKRSEKSNAMDTSQ